MATTKPKKDSETAARRRGRPVSPTGARETFQLRVTADQRARWQAKAEARVQSESEWAREALDAWVTVCERAAAHGVEPSALFADALEAYGRVRAAIAELGAARALSTTEQRLLRVLAPTEWARREAT